MSSKEDKIFEANRVVSFDAWLLAVPFEVAIGDMNITVSESIIVWSVSVLLVECACK